MRQTTDIQTTLCREICSHKRNAYGKVSNETEKLITVTDGHGKQVISIIWEAVGLHIYLRMQVTD